MFKTYIYENCEEVIMNSLASIVDDDLFGEVLLECKAEVGE